MWTRVNRNWWEQLPYMAWLGFSMFSFSFGLFILLWLNHGWAAVTPEQDIRERWRAASRGGIQTLLLSGEFTSVSSGHRMSVLIGTDSGSNQARAVIMRAGSEKSEAYCRVIAFERYRKDLKPAFLSMDCEGINLTMMRMPVQITWNGKNASDATIRLGSALFDVEETKLALSVNRYSIPSKVALAR